MLSMIKTMINMHFTLSWSGPLLHDKIFKKIMLTELIKSVEYEIDAMQHYTQLPLQML